MGVGKRFLAHVPAGDDPFGAICDALAASEAFAAEARLSDGAATRLQVVVEELITNVLRHGLATQVELALEALPDGVDLAVEDDGIAFDPTQPSAFAGPDTETGGGVGLALVRAWSLRWDYVRERERNRSELTLALPA